MPRTRQDKLGGGGTPRLRYFLRVNKTNSAYLSLIRSLEEESTSASLSYVNTAKNVAPTVKVHRNRNIFVKFAGKWSKQETVVGNSGLWFWVTRCGHR